MSLNNSREFPSILLVDFSILHTEGKTKLSKNGKENMMFFVILSRSTKNKEQCLAFLHRLFEQKYMRASVRAIETIMKLFDLICKNRLPRGNVPRFYIDPSTTSV